MKTLYNNLWSIELDRRIQHTSYLRLVKSQYKTKIYQQRRLLEIKSKLPPEYDTNITTLAHSMKQVKVTRKKSRKTISIVPLLRKQQLQELSIALEIDGKYSKDKEIQHLMTIEQT